MSGQSHIPGQMGLVTLMADSALPPNVLETQLRHFRLYHSGLECSKETPRLVVEQVKSREKFSTVSFIPSLGLVTDTSLQGWGAYLLGAETGETGPSRKRNSTSIIWRC